MPAFSRYQNFREIGNNRQLPERNAQSQRINGNECRDAQGGQSSTKTKRRRENTNTSSSEGQFLPTSRSSVDEYATTQGNGSESPTKRHSVKAMAAMIEDQESLHDTSPVRQLHRTECTGSEISIVSSGRHIRHSKSGPLWTRYNAQKSPWAGNQSVIIGQNDIVNIPSETLPRRRLRASASAASGLRESGTSKARKSQNTDVSERCLMNDWQNVKKAAMQDHGVQTEPLLKMASSLGTMPSYPELPPVAQHLNLARPPSSLSTVPRDVDAINIIPLDSGTPTRPRSTTILHSQIRNLQRRLAMKTEEAAQLRRQLEAQEDAESGTLSEQLRQATRDMHMWKERATTAEKRIQVFEQFTAKLRGIRDGQVSVSSGRRSGHTSRFGSKAHDDDADDASSIPRVRFVNGTCSTGRSTEAARSDDSGKTEDGGIVMARIRNCLHGPSPGLRDEALDTSRYRHPRLTLGKLDGLDGVASASSDEEFMSEFSLGAMEMWIAAQELLRMEEERSVSSGE